ncbi:MAG: hypothetical protein ACK57I_02865 [Akkermansiaceae bacterium]
MKAPKLLFLSSILATLVIIASCGGKSGSEKSIELLNVSYDPTREFYFDVNRVLDADWKKK